MNLFRLHLLAWGLGGATLAAAQAPQYTAELLGPGTVVNDMNDAGAVVGWTVDVGVVQAYVAAPGAAHTILPLPAGYSSAWAQGINDAGVVVGSASRGNFPEFGQAIAWLPDGVGGYNTALLGALPGHSQSVAYDVNDAGQIVGSSLIPGFQGGPTVWFNSPSGLLDISALGAPSSPKEINDQGVVVGINGDLFDVNALQLIPLPALPPGWTLFQGWAINELGELAGTGFQGGITRSAAIWTLGGGWQSISNPVGISASVQAFDINTAGVAHAEVPAPAAYLPGQGTFGLASLLVPAQQGSWVFSLSLGGALNEAGQIAAIGQDLASGQSGVVLLTPSNCSAPNPYCTSTVNSSGVPAQMAWAGTASLAVNAFELRCTGASSSQPGVFFHGAAQIQSPFGDGFRCVGGSVQRLQVLQTTGAGTAALFVDLPSLPGAAPGVSRNFQLWFRDPGGPGGSGFNLSNGLEVTLCN